MIQAFASAIFAALLLIGGVIGVRATHDRFAHPPIEESNLTIAQPGSITDPFGTSENSAATVEGIATPATDIAFAQSQPDTSSEIIKEAQRPPPAPPRDASADKPAMSNDVLASATATMNAGRVLGASTEPQPLIMVQGGITQEQLTAQLEALKLDLTGRIGGVASSAATQSNTIFESLGMATRVEELSNTKLHTPTIDGATITGGSISGASISGNIIATDFSGILDIASGGTGTSSAPTYGKVLVGNSSGGYDLSATSSLGISGSGSGAVGSGTQGQFAFYNAAGTTLTATSSLFLAQNGNVGIGTTSPQAALHVAGQSIFGSNSLPTGSLSSFAGSKALLYDDGGNGFATLMMGARDSGGYAGSDVLYGYADSSNAWHHLFEAGAEIQDTSDILSRDYFIQDTQASKYRFLIKGNGDIGLGGDIPYGNALTNASLVIKNGGNVGIGTTSPSARLTVAGPSVPTTSYKSSPWWDTPVFSQELHYANFSGLTGSNYTNGYANDYMRSDFDITNSNGAIWGQYNDLVVSNTATGNTSTVYGSEADAIYKGTVSSTGLVLIGANGNANNSSGGTTIGSATGVYSTGLNYAIGATTTNLYGVELVVGNSAQYSGATNAFGLRSNIVNHYANSTITNTYGLHITSLTNAGTITNTYGVYTGDLTTGTQTNTPYSFYASDANALNYFAGNVGIGTTSPETLTHWYGNTPILRVDNSAASASYLHFRRPGVDEWSLGMDGSDSNKFKIANSNAFSGARLTIDSSGNVGIGTTNPGATLSVVGNARFGNVDLGAVWNFYHATNGLGVYAAIQTGTPADQGSLLTMTHGGTVTGSVFGLSSSVSSTGDGLLALQQNSSGRGVMRALTLGAGDVLSEYTVNGVTSWSVGLDNSDSDKFKIDTGLLGDNNWFVITTAGNVGIGTASPGKPLEVSPGTLRLQGLAVDPFYYTDFAQDYGVGGLTITQNTIGSPNTSVTLKAGNVGIASTTPWAKLSVTNTGSGPSFVVEDDTSPDSTPFIVTASGDVGIGMPNPTYPLHIGVSNGATSAYFNGNLKSSFYRQWTIGPADSSGSFLLTDDSAGQTRFAIDGSGNVGIGTTSPATALEISNSTTGSAPTLRLSGWDAGAGTMGGSLSFYENNYVNKEVAKINVVRPAGGTQANLTFSTYNGSSLAEAMRIDLNGNVGIGTTTPDAKLVVTDANASILKLNVTNAPGTYYTQLVNNYNGAEPFYISNGATGAESKLFGVKTSIGGDSNHTAYVSNYYNVALATGALNPTESNVRLFINQTGNVGIGTTTPLTKLDIKQASNDFAGGLTLRRSNSNDSWQTVVGSDNNLYFGYANNASNADAVGDYSIPAALTSAGEVYLGGQTYSRLGLAGGDSPYLGYNLKYSSGYKHDSTGSLAGIASANDGSLQFYADSSQTANTAAPERMRIASSGNVGIGNTSPQTNLHVTGNTGSYSSNFTSGGSPLAASLYLGDGNFNSSGYYNSAPGISAVYDSGTGVAGALAFYNYAGLSNSRSEAMRITYPGNVGIGTTTPETKLVVQGTSEQWFDNSTNYRVVQFDTNRISFLGNRTNYFLTYDTSNLRLGVGPTTTPWRTLSVTGTVGFDGLTGSTGAGSLCLDSNKQVVYNSGSDACQSSTRATKHAIEGLSLDGLTIIDALQPVSFIYNEGDGRTRYGFIAEDTAGVDAHLATYNASGTVSGIDDRSIIAILVSALKQIWAKVMALVQSDEEQNAEIEQLKARVSQLEAAAGTPQSGLSGGTGGSSAPQGVDTDTATTTTSSGPEPTAANDNQATDDTLLVDTPAAPEPPPELEPANDNPPVDLLPATGTE